MAFPAEHFGAAKKRRWYKVMWKESANPALAGNIDLLADDDYQRQQQHVDVLDVITTDQCNGGTPLGFGRWTEQQIETWITRNRQ